MTGTWPACAPADEGSGEGGAGEPQASLGRFPDDLAGGADADTIPPPVENGVPMLPASEAGGIVPFPGAIVHLRNREPRPMFVIEAFTPVGWDSVVAFYDEKLSDWEIVHARDMAIYRRQPGDRAAVTVSPWQAQDLPPDAPAVLRNARTAIGAAWR